MIGLGLRNYARDKFNVFDCIIVIVSLVDFGLEFGLGSDNGTDAIMSALEPFAFSEWSSLPVIGRHSRRFCAL